MDGIAHARRDHANLGDEQRAVRDAAGAFELGLGEVGPPAPLPPASTALGGALLAAEGPARQTRLGDLGGGDERDVDHRLAAVGHGPEQPVHGGVLVVLGGGEPLGKHIALGQPHQRRELSRVELGAVDRLEAGVGHAPAQQHVERRRERLGAEHVELALDDLPSLARRFDAGDGQGAQRQRRRPVPQPPQPVRSHLALQAGEHHGEVLGSRLLGPVEPQRIPALHARATPPEPVGDQHARRHRHDDQHDEQQRGRSDEHREDGMRELCAACGQP
jgi:hypothetical protein